MLVFSWETKEKCLYRSRSHQYRFNATNLLNSSNSNVISFFVPKYALLACHLNLVVQIQMGQLWFNLSFASSKLYTHKGNAIVDDWYKPKQNHNCRQTIDQSQPDLCETLLKVGYFKWDCALRASDNLASCYYKRRI